MIEAPCATILLDFHLRSPSADRRPVPRSTTFACRGREVDGPPLLFEGTAAPPACRGSREGHAAATKILKQHDAHRQGPVCTVKRIGTAPLTPVPGGRYHACIAIGTDSLLMSMHGEETLARPRSCFQLLSSQTHGPRPGLAPYCRQRKGSQLQVHSSLRHGVSERQVS